jgi:hypothetical protein
VFVRRLTLAEVKEENEASPDSLLDKGKEVFLFKLGCID